MIPPRFHTPCQNCTKHDLFVCAVTCLCEIFENIIGCSLRLNSNPLLARGSWTLMFYLYVILQYLDDFVHEYIGFEDSWTLVTVGFLDLS